MTNVNNASPAINTNSETLAVERNNNSKILSSDLNKTLPAHTSGNLRTALQPKKLCLTVKSSFKASHSLAGFETPHFHLWQINVQFEADLPLKTDRLIDLVFLQTTVEEIYRPIEGKFLNVALQFSPTSENLAQWFWTKLSEVLPSAPLSAVEVSLCDLEGRSSGSARIYR